jgi:methionyl-tRNA formyltransferase
MAPLRIVFMGTAEFSCASLEKLAGDPRFQIVSVVTQPDKPRGRDLKLQPTAVKSVAQRLNLPVSQPLKARDPLFLETLRGLQPDLVVVVAYGQILPQTLLDLPRFGCLNVHTSLLPKYRGAAPIQWAVANGEAETGVTIMKMDAGLDTGPILSVRATPILPADNSALLHDRLAQLGAELLVETIPGFVAGLIQPQPQPVTGSSYAAKIKKEDGKIDWRQPAREIWNRSRAFTPWPGAFTFLAGHAPAEPSPASAAPIAAKPMLLKIWQLEVVAGQGTPGEVLPDDQHGIVVACGESAVRIVELQREGGRRLPARAFLAGHPLKPGTRFL